MFTRYKKAVEELRIIELRIRESRRLIKIATKLSKSNGDRAKFYKEHKGEIFNCSLEGENLKFPLEEIIENLEMSEIGYDTFISPEEEAKFLEDFKDFFN